MKSPQWHLLHHDQDAAQHLHKNLHIAPLYCQMLVQRGVKTLTEVQSFLQPDLDALHDPFLMRDMDRAVDRLHTALKEQDRILLYGDYDVDGTTSVALMYTFLSAYTNQLDYYLPDREKEGYGVSLAGVEYAREHKCKLIIAMDCGIKGHAAVNLAKSYGIDFIICDHHLPEGGLPDAVANLDPKRDDCPYPFKELSGCGIAFKLAQAMNIREEKPFQAIAHLLDLVATSIACDIVPIMGENRILAWHGMKLLNHNPSTGIWAILNRINRPSPMSVSDLVFHLGPIINAAGRLGDAKEAVKLMLSVDRNSALDQARNLIARNNERRKVDMTMAEEARRRINNDPDLKTKKGIVLYDPDWHKGIIGILASRMTEAYHKPSVILTQSNGRAVGSARSVRGFDLYQAFQQCEDLFYSYGGHAHAAGMQMPEENIPAFEARFEELIRLNLPEGGEAPLIEISAKIVLDDITPDLWYELKKFEPFGPENRNPVFWASDVIDSGKSKILDNNHVRLSVRQRNGKKILGGIGFGLGNAFETLKNKPFDMAFNIREEIWNNQKVLSLQVKDLRPAGI